MSQQEVYNGKPFAERCLTESHLGEVWPGFHNIGSLDDSFTTLKKRINDGPLKTVALLPFVVARDLTQTFCNFPVRLFFPGDLRIAEILFTQIPNLARGTLDAVGARRAEKVITKNLRHLKGKNNYEPFTDFGLAAFSILAETANVLTDHPRGNEIIPRVVHIEEEVFKIISSDKKGHPSPFILQIVSDIKGGDYNRFMQLIRMAVHPRYGKDGTLESLRTIGNSTYDLIRHIVKKYRSEKGENIDLPIELRKEIFGWVGGNNSVVNKIFQHMAGLDETNDHSVSSLEPPSKRNTTSRRMEVLIRELSAKKAGLDRQKIIAEHWRTSMDLLSKCDGEGSLSNLINTIKQEFKSLVEFEGLTVDDALNFIKEGHSAIEGLINNSNSLPLNSNLIDLWLSLLGPNSVFVDFFKKKEEDEGVRFEDTYSKLYKELVTKIIGISEAGDAQPLEKFIGALKTAIASNKTSKKDKAFINEILGLSLLRNVDGRGSATVASLEHFDPKNESSWFSLLAAWRSVHPFGEVALEMALTKPNVEVAKSGRKNLDHLKVATDSWGTVMKKPIKNNLNKAINFLLKIYQKTGLLPSTVQGDFFSKTGNRIDLSEHDSINGAYARFRKILNLVPLVSGSELKSNNLPISVSIKDELLNILNTLVKEGIVVRMKRGLSEKSSALDAEMLLTGFSLAGAINSSQYAADKERIQAFALQYVEGLGNLILDKKADEDHRKVALYIMSAVVPSMGTKVVREFFAKIHEKITNKTPDLLNNKGLTDIAVALVTKQDNLSMDPEEQLAVGKIVVDYLIQWVSIYNDAWGADKSGDKKKNPFSLMLDDIEGKTGFINLVNTLCWLAGEVDKLELSGQGSEEYRAKTLDSFWAVFEAIEAGFLVMLKRDHQMAYIVNGEAMSENRKGIRNFQLEELRKGIDEYINPFFQLFNHKLASLSKSSGDIKKAIEGLEKSLEDEMGGFSQQETNEALADILDMLKQLPKTEGVPLGESSGLDPLTKPIVELFDRIAIVNSAIELNEIVVQTNKQLLEQQQALRKITETARSNNQFPADIMALLSQMNQFNQGVINYFDDQGDGSKLVTAMIDTLRGDDEFAANLLNALSALGPEGKWPQDYNAVMSRLKQIYKLKFKTSFNAEKIINKLKGKKIDNN